MIIAVGSLNKVKIEATKEAFEQFYDDIIIKACDVKYHIKQPLNIEDTINGAIYRAKTALDGYEADYGVGIEAGLIKALNYHLNIQIAAIICNDIALGFSAAFQLPTQIEKLVLNGLEIDEAVEMLFNIKDIGEKGGIIELMSKGKITRKMLIADAVRMALVKVINK